VNRHERKTSARSAVASLARGHRRRAACALAGALSWLGAACNLIVDTSSEQCDTDRDCAAKGAAFASTFCTSQKVCGPLPCTSSRECTERLGEPSYCRPDSTCTRVLTSDCFEVVPAGALSADQVILAGFMGPLRDAFASYGGPIRQGAELALNEIKLRGSGLPPTPGGRPRELAMLVCHDNPDDSNQERHLDVARHLVNQVQVRTIIGPLYSGPTIAVSRQVTGPAGVLAISPSATDPAITGSSDLLWRTVPSDLAQADALALLVTEAEKALQADGILTEGQRAKVAYTVRGDSYGQGISDAFLQKSTGRTLESMKYDNPRVGATKWDEIAQWVVTLRPHIVLGFGTTEFVTDILPRIEERWGASPAWRPRYLLPEGPRVDELFREVEKQPDLSARILGTAPGAGSQPGFGRFVTNFQQTFGGPPGNLAEFAYDAVYLLAYSIGITQQPAPTGRQLAAALTRVSCKGRPQIFADPVPFTQGFRTASELAPGDCVDFDGVSGPLDFDNGAHEAASDIALWCPAKNEANTWLFRRLETYYDHLAGEFARLPVGGIAFCP
jgi:branched-chain amino acid transport system substrate-binding protein